MPLTADHRHDLPAMLAERLDLPQATFLRSLSVDGGTLHAERVVEGGYSELEAPLPAECTALIQALARRAPS